MLQIEITGYWHRVTNLKVDQLYATLQVTKKLKVKKYMELDPLFTQK